jgi:hypothetical protein
MESKDTVRRGRSVSDGTRTSRSTAPISRAGSAVPEPIERLCRAIVAFGSFYPVVFVTCRPRERRVRITEGRRKDFQTLLYRTPRLYRFVPPVAGRPGTDTYRVFSASGERWQRSATIAVTDAEGVVSMVLERE